MKTLIFSISFFMVITPAFAVERSAFKDGLIAASGVSGGVVVQLGCGDGESTAELHSGDKFLIYGLDINANAVEKAKEHIAARGVYGQISAETYDGKNLPFGDNIVNLFIVEDAAQVSAVEIERVLAPKGVVLVKSGSALLNSAGLKKEGTVDGWDKYRKPWPADIDEWPQFLYDSSNNAVSRDKRVGKPRHLQWFAGPRYTRDHDALASMSAMTSSDGRVFYIFDEGPTSLSHQPADWKLIARDAFNGKRLWKRDISSWMAHLYNFRAGPVQLPRRLVSLDDKVYVTLSFEAPVQKLDGATGKTLMTYEGSDDAEEMIWHDGMLLVVKGDPGFWIEESPNCHGYWDIAEREEARIPKQILAYDAETGKLLWNVDDPDLKTLVPLSLCAQGTKVFYLDGKQLHCLNATDGKELWAAPFETSGSFLRAYAPTVVVHDDVILCLHLRQGLQAFSVETGKRLWKTEKASIGFASPGDVLVKDGKAWMLPMDKSKVTFNGFQETVAVAIDIHTGKVAKTMPFVKNQHHHRCFRDKATDRCILIGYSGIQVFDWEKGTTDLNRWIRGLCQYGMMPANGYIYVPPDPCRCASHEKANGFYVLSEKNSLDDIKVEHVLEKGPEYGRRPTEAASPNDWATYRGNPARDRGANGALPDKLTVKWEANVGKSITASVVAGYRVFLADRDAYSVYCLNAADGKQSWRFMANGPVDSPPTLAGGFCVFGGGDGSVYCLSAENGRLVWRFKVSRLERRVGSEDRLESPWRINGSVLVLDGTVYFCAGRSSHLDGGIKLYGLDLVTGRKKYSNEVVSPPNSESGSLSDILAASGAGIHMRHVIFDHQLEPRKNHPKTVKGMLDDSWFHRLWGDYREQLHATNDGGTYTVSTPYSNLKGKRRREPQKYNQTGKGFHQKYTRYETEWFPIGVTIEKRGVWKIQEAFQPRSMVVAGDQLVLAGWLDGMHIEKKTGLPVGGKPVERVSVLRVYSTEDGERISEYKLESEPIWDSAAIAYGNLFLSLQSGKVVCMGE